MRIVRVSGRMGIHGRRVELAPGPGLVALLGDRRAVEAAQALVTSAVVGPDGQRRWGMRDATVDVALPGVDGVVRLGAGSRDTAPEGRLRLQEALGLQPWELALAWTGGTTAEAGSTVARGAGLLAARAGLDRLERLLAAVSSRPGATGASGNGDGAAPYRPATPEGELVRVEEELRTLREDSAVVQGDLEEATMEWLRERQDAETTLLAYRDRARELKGRLSQLDESGPDATCPTCGRPLSSHFDTVSVQLREEWEGVVQDGQWWKRRRDQLELKPDRLRELEGRSLRLHAAVQEATERAEHLRTELESRGRPGAGPATREVPPALARAAESLSDPAAVGGALALAAEGLVQASRTSLMSATAKMLNRVSGGRLVGLEPGEAADGTLVPRPVSGAPGTEDAAAARVAAHLALASQLFKLGSPLGSLLVGAPFSTMGEEDQIRAAAVLRSLTRRFAQILVLPSAAVVEALPEAFDAVWEIRPEPEPGLPALRPLTVGVGSVRLESGIAAH